MGINPWKFRPVQIQGASWWVRALGLLIGLATAVLFHVSPNTLTSLALPPLAASIALPDPQPHHLPPFLAQWQDQDQSGDYFDQIQSVSVGYLVWSHFPIAIYVDPLKPGESIASFVGQQAQTWRDAMLAAIQEWSPYLPLKLVEQVEQADIVILRAAPPLQLERPTRPPAPVTSSPSPSLAGLRLARARSAETRFELYAQPAATQGQRPILAHRVTIRLRPDQAVVYLRASARHELGHALGIWGHSPLPTDALYAAQVANPAGLSHRDINTLKRIYQQPTRLGWPLPQ